MFDGLFDLGIKKHFRMKEDELLNLKKKLAFFFNLKPPPSAKNSKFKFFKPTLCLFFTIKF